MACSNVRGAQHKHTINLRTTPPPLSTHRVCPRTSSPAVDGLCPLLRQAGGLAVVVLVQVAVAAERHLHSQQ
jgi:hypothetical protein